MLNPLNVSYILVSVIVILANVCDGHSVMKRSIFNLAQVINCATNRSAINYVGYGCYCGIGGRGYPVDDIDRCCFDHDRCYDMAQDFGICRSWTRYMLSYDWSCDNNRQPVCKSLGSSCSAYLCRCDVEAAKCFASKEYPDVKPNCPHSSSTPAF